MQIIDAHQHFWKISRGDYYWMDDSVKEIRRDILPPELAKIALPRGISATIVVQAAATVDETRFLLSLANDTDWIKGVVGWIDLEKKDAPHHIDELSRHSAFKGIRPMLQDIDDTNWILQADIIKNLEYIAHKDLSLDALITPRHLPIIDQLAQLIPQLPIVIDHCAKPEIANGADAGTDWRQGMKMLAGHKNIYCKLSGLANEYGSGWDTNALSPISAFILDVFGPERVMWGSDWPVLELAGRYDNWLNTAIALTTTLSDQEQEDVFSGTAKRFYRLESD